MNHKAIQEHYRKRRERALALIAKGLSRKAVAAKMGVTTERVRQIVKAAK